LDPAQPKDSWIGRRLPRVDAEAKLRGATRFLPDLNFPGLLHAKQILSTEAHARLLSLDTAAAETAPGVRALLTADRLPAGGENRVGVIIDDQPLLAVDRLRHHGECIAVVAAESEAEAAAAARLVQVRSEALPAILGFEDLSPQPEEPIHESGPIAVHHRVKRGNTASGFAEAAAVVEAEFTTGPQEHYYLEPLGCVARPEEGGGVTIFGSLQCPFYVQKAVARACGLSLDRVRVIQTPTGGAFGGKEDVPNEICARAAVLALMTGRPVRLLLERREDIQCSSKRHPYRIRLRLGATADGCFTAMEIFQDALAGPYATLSPPVLYRSAMQGAGPYRIPAVHVEARAWYSNTAPAGAFRGFGSPQASFAHEGIIDLLAEKLSLNPFELRRRNLLRAGDETATGHKLESSVGMESCFEAALSAAADELGEAALHGTGRPPTEADLALDPVLAEHPERWQTGTGIGCMIYGNCLGKAGWHMDGAAANLQLHADGSASLAVGLTEIGQGAETVVTQFAAEGLGLDPSRIKLLPVDTALVRDSGPTVASRNVVMSGNAIADATRQLRERLAPLAAELLHCDPDALCFAGGEVRGPASTLPMEELAEQACRRDIDLAAEGWWHAPPLEFDMKRGLGEAYFAYSFAAQVARVAVDRLSGQVRVIKVWAAHDLGRAVNPAGAEGQVEGGVLQGIGWALGERVLSEEGRILSENLSTYPLPITLEAPPIDSILVEDPHPEGPAGAKSLGEPVIIPTAAALAGALRKATGAPIRELPVDPESLLPRLEVPRHVQRPV
jgi:CO/xanthine dehydrogenase Mo-binding subunit